MLFGMLNRFEIPWINCILKTTRRETLRNGVHFFQSLHLQTTLIKNCMLTKEVQTPQQQSVKHKTPVSLMLRNSMKLYKFATEEIYLSRAKWGKVHLIFSSRTTNTLYTTILLLGKRNWYSNFVPYISSVPKEWLCFKSTSLVQNWLLFIQPEKVL